MRTGDLGPPPGWTASDNTLKPTETAAGYRARGEDLEGGCRQHGCRRKCWIDPHARTEAAMLEHASLEMLDRLFRCGRPDGCFLRFARPRPGQSVKVNQLYGRTFVRIRVRCDACRWFRLRRAEELGAHLETLRAGWSNCRTAEVGEKIKGPCPACKETRWSAHVIWLNTNTAIWRAKGERMFEEMAAD